MKRKSSCILCLVSATEAGRLLDLPASKIIRAVHAGKLKPDTRIGTTFVFRESRLPAIAKAVRRGAATVLSCLAALLFFSGQAYGQLFQHVTILSLGAGVGSQLTNCLTGSVTLPITCLTGASNSYQGAYTVTNIQSGIVDFTRSQGFYPHVQFNCTGAASSPVIWEWMPSLDGINFDTANTTFWVTNTEAGTSFASCSTNFPDCMCRQFGYWKLVGVSVGGGATLTNVLVQAGLEQLQPVR
jgi:hypothetical protein